MVACAEDSHVMCLEKEKNKKNKLCRVPSKNEKKNNTVVDVDGSMRRR